MRCSHCYQRGHNKRTCPVLTKRLKERHDADIEEGHTETWAIQQYKNRIAPKGTKKANQQCGYCGEYGHTRRKCEVLRKDKEWFVVNHNAHLRVAHDYIVSSPIGIGSLFKLTEQNYNYHVGDYETSHEMLVLTDFLVAPLVKQGGFKIFATLQHPTTGRKRQVDVREYVRNPDHGKGWRNHPTLLTPSCGIVPSGWIQSQTVTLASASKLDYFRRVGRKDEDHRAWIFSSIDRSREMLEKYEPSPDDRFDHHGRAKEDLEKYTPEHNRVSLFKDFKSGE